MSAIKSPAWNRRYLAYCRAMGINHLESMVRATDVKYWLSAQADIFRLEAPDSLDFDGWLDSRFPSVEAVAA
jgi:hypothetical protein